MPPALAATAERLAARLLDRADLQPGASAFEIAERLGHQVELVDRLPGSARGGRDPETCAILLVASPYARRLQLTAAHELIEHYLPGRLDPQWHEQFCQRGAAALLMPARAFAASAVSCGFGLPMLKAFWPHCSLESMLCRIVDLAPGTTASSWGPEGARFRRAHSGWWPSHAAAELDAFVAAEARWSRRESSVHAGRLAARAWPVGADRALSLCVSA